LQHKRELQRLSAELDDAREHERRTIARDLHDEIGQALMTIKLDLSVVDRSAQVSGSPAAALAEARSSTDHAIQTVRDLSQLLHPPMLDDFGLASPPPSRCTCAGLWTAAGYEPSSSSIAWTHDPRRISRCVRTGSFRKH
jgi:hypothetical protein